MRREEIEDSKRWRREKMDVKVPDDEDGMIEVDERRKELRT